MAVDEHFFALYSATTAGDKGRRFDACDGGARKGPFYFDPALVRTFNDDATKPRSPTNKNTCERPNPMGTPYRQPQPAAQHLLVAAAALLTSTGEPMDPKVIKATIEAAHDAGERPLRG